MKHFAGLLDRLSYEPRRNGKLKLLVDYLASCPDPDRGYALAALTGALSFTHAKPAMLRSLIAERTDPVLFALSYDFVGDLAETIALLWPSTPTIGHNQPELTLTDVVENLALTRKQAIPELISQWLNQLDETGRWALLKLITGGLRIGVSARLAKAALADLGQKDIEEIELLWPGLKAPYTELFHWLESRGPRPSSDDPAPFRPPMLAHPLDEMEVTRWDAQAFAAEWKWDGIRVQAASGIKGEERIARLFSRSGDDISASFPDLVHEITFNAAIDGELLVMQEGRIADFNTLQQRLNRKQPSKALQADYPVHLMAYDLLFDGSEDLRGHPFHIRRQRLERLIASLAHPRLHLSPQIPFASWDELAEIRLAPEEHEAFGNAHAVEGLMLKRLDSPYLPGRPKGYWFKWKHDPKVIDAVLLYAQRGHGKRSSLYSDFTFGLWRGEELVPVGKAYFGFTDAELANLDRFVRNHTVNRFGPVREVVHTAETGLVLEVAFEGVRLSSRHKSGVAMRFPRISRIRTDKTPAEADQLETLMLLTQK